jgi:WD40 repeat protein
LKIKLILFLLLPGAAMAQVVNGPVVNGMYFMQSARAWHTATLLQDGRVLIAGGESVSCCSPSNPPLASAEIYDPATPGFTSAGNMTTGRSGHTATLLPDGRVLIVGGDSSNGTAEFYDPSTGKFTAAGSLLMPQSGFNATLLSNGKVLITGGVNSASAVADAELFDPSTGQFTTAGPYVASLTGAFTANASTSTLLPDGTVLFAREPAAQIYDPATATFNLSGSMYVSFSGNPVAPDYVDGQTATLLLNSTVLVAGGANEDLGRFTSTELYNPVSLLLLLPSPLPQGVFVPAFPMLRPREDHTATLLPDGTVLMAGGLSQNCDGNSCFFSGSESSLELYDPTKGTFSFAGYMLYPRASHTATLLNTGDVLIAGGEAWGGFDLNYGSLASVELYHPAFVSSPPALFSAAGGAPGQGAVWHATTGQLASSQTPAVAGEILSMYVSGLAEGGAIPPQVAVGGRLAEILYFGDAPGYPGYYQVNFSLPSGLTPGPSVPVRLNYLFRTSNEVTIAVQ